MYPRFERNQARNLRVLLAKDRLYHKQKYILMKREYLNVDEIMARQNTGIWGSNLTPRFCVALRQ
jgi:hypothetical protein